MGSRKRAGKRHCVCIGAWSFYMTDAAKHPETAASIMPHCKAVPETSLTSSHLSHWKDWNGYPASVVAGIGELVSRCLNQETDQKLRCGLTKRFQCLTSEIPELTTASQLRSLLENSTMMACATFES